MTLYNTIDPVFSAINSCLGKLLGLLQLSILSPCHVEDELSNLYLALAARNVTYFQNFAGTVGFGQFTAQVLKFRIEHSRSFASNLKLHFGTFLSSSHSLPYVSSFSNFLVIRSNFADSNLLL